MSILRSGVPKASARTRGPGTPSHLAAKHSNRRKIMQVIMGHSFTCVIVLDYGNCVMGNDHLVLALAQAFTVRYVHK